MEKLPVNKASYNLCCIRYHYSELDFYSPSSVATVKANHTHDQQKARGKAP